MTFIVIPSLFVAGKVGNFRRMNIIAASSRITVLHAHKSLLPGRLYPTVHPARRRARYVIGGERCAVRAHVRALPFSAA